MHDQEPANPRGKRTPRAEGREHMLTAALAMLRERGPESITVREIAAACGHHHRFVQAWFGGKVGLFREAFDRLVEEIAASVRFDGSLMAERDPVLLVELMNWLVATDAESLSGPRPTPLVDRLRAMYETDFGLEEDVARLMALRLVTASISAILFSAPIGLTEDDFGAMAALEMEIAGLLAESRGTHPTGGD